MSLFLQDYGRRVVVPVHVISTIRRSINSSALTIVAPSLLSQSSSQSLSSPPKKEQITKFGKIFSPHMLTISYSNNQWYDPKIVPYGPLSISPGSACLNYGMTCFEGMKAYRSLVASCSSSGNLDDTKNDTLLLFRPDKNMERLSKSMERLSLPGFDFDRKELVRCIMKLVQLDQAWIPKGEGYSLYIRPNVIAMNENLGLSHPECLLLYVVTSPVGPYFSGGGGAGAGAGGGGGNNTTTTTGTTVTQTPPPIRLWCECHYVRAYEGGTGNCKIGGNYAPTMKPAKEAMQRGYSQVLWLSKNKGAGGDSSSSSSSSSSSGTNINNGSEFHVTEVGAMNIFFVFYHRETNIYEIVTPPLNRGDILPGVTRQSIVELAHGWGQEQERGQKRDQESDDVRYEMVERNVTMTEIQQAVHDGTLVEAFGAGTAAVVTPIECIHYNGVDYNIPATGHVTQRAWDELTEIQYGKVVDHPWSVSVCVDA